MSVGVDTGVVMMRAILNAGAASPRGPPYRIGQQRPRPRTGPACRAGSLCGGQSSGVKRTPDETGRANGARRTPASSSAWRAAVRATDEE